MNLPKVIPLSEAALPQAYEKAKTALAECSKIDECKDWADKAAALASYARQAQDDQLEKYSQRIRARAIRREGELWKQLDGRGGDTSKSNAGDTFAAAKESQKNLMEKIGVSKRHVDTAKRVANVPERDFEEQVEGPRPPTLSELASQGVKPRQPVDLGGRDPKAFNNAMHFTGLVTRYAKDLAEWDVNAVLPHLDDKQRGKLREALGQIDVTHDQIATRI